LNAVRRRSALTARIGLLLLHEPGTEARFSGSRRMPQFVRTHR
jgi:hypothetical protein